MSTGGTGVRYVVWQRGGPRPLARLPLPRLAGPAWLAWRSRRGAYLAGAAVLVGLVAWVLWECHALASGVDGYVAACRAAASACPPSGYTGPPPVPGAAHVLFDEGPLVCGLLPVALGALVGGPLFAPEWESGTHRLAWTQSVTRRQWAGARLALAAGLTAAGTAALSAAVSWWWLMCWRGQHTAGYSGYAWRTLTAWDTWRFFPVVGTVAIAQGVLAVVLGAAVGLLVRRTLPAVLLAGLCAEGVTWGLGLLRPHLLRPTITARPGLWFSPPPDAWHLSEGYQTASGQHLPTSLCRNAPDWEACAARLGVTGHYTRDLPMSRFLPLQAVETTLCLAAAAALAAWCLWRVERVRVVR